MTIAAVAWDIDGLLIDSEPLHHEALLAASRALGVDLADLAPDAFAGVHMLDVWRALAPRFPATIEREPWLTAIEAYYVERASETREREGAMAAMRRLHTSGVPQACVSNSSRRVVDANLVRLEATGLVEFSISLNDVTNGKPDPEPYALAARRLALPPEHVLAVEDSAAGARSARAAGLKLATVGPLVVDSDWRLTHLSEVVEIVLPR